MNILLTTIMKDTKLTNDPDIESHLRLLSGVPDAVLLRAMCLYERIYVWINDAIHGYEPEYEIWFKEWCWRIGIFFCKGDIAYYPKVESIRQAGMQNAGGCEASRKFWSYLQLQAEKEQEDFIAFWILNRRQEIPNLTWDLSQLIKRSPVPEEGEFLPTDG
jgi:hypothetical protein